MIIAVWGFTGSGKNTLGELIAKKLGYKMVDPTFKDLAAKEGISLMEFQKNAAADHNIDKKFDELLKEQVRAAGNNCVVTTWLGPWMVDANVRIKLNVPLEIRAERVARRDKMTVAEAKKHVAERDKQNIKRYYDVYKIDITDDSKFDLQLQGGKSKPEELLVQAMKVIEKKK
ncbi:MAG: cytidylate kinase family protein [Candidatus Micrarchaeota archaeon]